MGPARRRRGQEAGGQAGRGKRGGARILMFLSGWLGGPDLFVEKFCHPRLRARHMPFAIGIKERDQWVGCMMLAMEEVGIDKAVRERLLQNFFQTADFMRNQPG